MTTPKNLCSQCGAPLDPEFPDSPCPACLLEFAAETELMPSSELSSEMEIEMIRQAFPQLEVIELIGRGGMGSVFLARQPKLDRFVALKIMPENQARHPSFAERFAREGKLLARLSHPNIVAVYDFGQTEIAVPGEEEPVTYFYLVMEYVDGVDLRHAMREERFSPEQALSIVPKICDALHYAHEEGVLHRDIKPENILLDTKGRVKIADFGIASASVARWTADGATAPNGDPLPLGAGIEERKLTLDGQIVGTPNYMAPEQFEAADKIDPRADIYSLGVVFYELLTGELPKGDFPKPSAKSPVGSEIDGIVMKALEKNRDKRYKSAEEFKTEVYHTTYVLNHKAKDPEPAQKRSKEELLLHERRKAVMLGLLPLLVLLGLIVFFATNGPPPERINPPRANSEESTVQSGGSDAVSNRFEDEGFLEETRRRMAMAWIIVLVLVAIIIVQYIRWHRRHR